MAKTASKSFSQSNSSQSHYFSLFWCILCTATLDITSFRKTITIGYSKLNKNIVIRKKYFLIKVCRIISFRIMSKITVNRKEKGLNKTEIYLPWKLPRFLKVILDGAFRKFISKNKKKFNVSNKVTSIVSVDAFIIISLIYYWLEKRDLCRNISSQSFRFFQ